VGRNTHAMSTWQINTKQLGVFVTDAVHRTRTVGFGQASLSKGELAHFVVPWRIGTKLKRGRMRSCRFYFTGVDKSTENNIATDDTRS
jgi:hypothetical protein